MAGYRLIAEAQRELRSGTSFYEAQYPGLGKDFVFEIRQLCRRIVEAPHLGTEVQSGVRRRHGSCGVEVFAFATATPDN